RWAKPPTSREFDEPRAQAAARRALGLPQSGKLIAISGGGWGVGDLVGATKVALEFEDAIVLCLCGRNDKLRAKVVQRFGGEPRLRVMGFTDRMGDVLAAADALVHSSAGLTVLEAIIRGCPVVSYGFGVGHVRASNAALERFKLAQVARRESNLRPDLERALEQRPEPDASFARRPSTASLILSDERRVHQLPIWRLRTARAATTVAATVAVVAWAMTTGASYSLVSHFAPRIKPVTAVSTDRPEVGVLVEAPGQEIPALASALSNYGIHASFAVNQPTSPVENTVGLFHDEALPRLPTGGLVRWLGTRGELHHLDAADRYRHPFLYASNGPSLGQWLFAHGVGGRLVAGAVRLHDSDDSLGALRPGEVVEVNVTSSAELEQVLGKLVVGLHDEHLAAVPVGRLMQDADRGGVTASA
ncbi:MAG: glycosyltransferase, partial [Solirubrobacteraceae bacterium]